MTCRHGLVALLLLSACTSTRREVLPEASFVDIPDTIDTRYSQVPAAAWLGDQRWVVVAQEYDEAIRVDFADGSVVPVGGRARTGAYQNPANAFAVGDTIWLNDWGLRRVTVWGPGDSLLRTFPVPDGLRGNFPQARDAAGQLYFEVAPAPGRLGEGNRDSAAIVRASPDLARFDTVARLAPIDIAEILGRSGRRFERRVFSGTDEWGVLPDGSLWVARVHNNRVFWLTPDGKWARGPSLPDPVFEVTAADREFFVQQFPQELQATADELPFALVKPPFERGMTSADGEIWLQKSRPILDSVRRYQVVGRDGRPRAVYVHPRDGFIIAVGRNTVLVAEQHLEGVRLLQRTIPDLPEEGGR